MKKIIIIIFLCCVAVPARASVSYNLNLGFENLHFVLNRGQYSINDQLTFDVEPGFVFDNEKNFKVDLKPRLRVDALDSSRNRYLPNEAYFKFYQSHVEVNAGFQILGMGVATFYNPTQVFQRYDLEDNLYDPEIMGELIFGVKLLNEKMGMFKNVSLEFVVLPWLQETPLPNNDTRFPLAGIEGGVPWELDERQALPDSYFESMGLGVVLSALSGGVDWNLLYYHGPDRTPGYFLTPNDRGALRLRPFYYTIDAIGSNFSFAVGSFLFHCELIGRITAANKVVTHNLAGQTEDMVPSSYFQFVPGVDYTVENILGDNILRMTLEYYGENNRSQNVGEYRPFKNDLFFGFDFDLNNTKLTHFKLGFLKDLSKTDLIVVVDFETKIYKELKWGLRSYLVNRDSDTNASLSFFDNNTFIATRLSCSF